MIITMNRLIAVCLPLLLAACGSGSAPCGNNETAKEYLVNNYQVKVVQYATPIDNQSEYKIPVTVGQGAVVDWNKFSLEVMADFQTYNVNNSDLLTISLFNAANACSPNTGTAKQKLKGISITSSRDFSRQYPAGSELAGLFSLIEFPYAPAADFGKASMPAPKIIKLYLVERPEGKQHNFTITLTLDDQQTFLLSTGDVQFN